MGPDSESTGDLLLDADRKPSSTINCKIADNSPETSISALARRQHLSRNFRHDLGTGYVDDDLLDHNGVTAGKRLHLFDQYVYVMAATL